MGISWTWGLQPSSLGDICPLELLWEPPHNPFPWCLPAPRWARESWSGLMAARVLCSRQRVIHRNVMIRSHRGSQNRQGTGRGAWLSLVSPATWTRTFLSTSTLMLALLQNHPSAWLRCLLHSSARTKGSQISRSGSKHQTLEAWEGEKCLSSYLLVEQMMWFLSGLERHSLTRPSQHPRQAATPGRKHLHFPFVHCGCTTLVGWIKWVTRCVNTSLCRIMQSMWKPID